MSTNGHKVARLHTPEKIKPTAWFTLVCPNHVLEKIRARFTNIYTIGPSTSTASFFLAKPVGDTVAGTAREA